MKTVSMRGLQQQIGSCVRAAQKDRVILTRHGKPAAVLVGVEGQDWEDVVMETSASFWKVIEHRRRQKTVSMAEVQRRLKI